MSLFMSRQAARRCKRSSDKQAATNLIRSTSFAKPLLQSKLWNSLRHAMEQVTSQGPRTVPEYFGQEVLCP